MTIPYHARIMAALPGHAEIELCRFMRKFYPQDFDHQTSHLGPEWEVWLEKPLTNSQTITARPGTRSRRHGPLPAPKMTPEQHAKMEAAGIAPAYMQEAAV